MTEKCKRTPLKKQPKTLLEIAVPLVDSLPKPEPLVWTIRDVSIWLRILALPQYIPTFKVNLITGRKLLLLNPKRLFQINIRNYEHQVRLLTEIQKLFKIEKETVFRNISLPQRQPETHYKLFNTNTGQRYERMSRTAFFREEMKILREPKPILNHFERLHQHLQRRPPPYLVTEQELFGGVRRNHCCV